MTEEHTDEWKDCQKTEVVEAKGPFTDPQVVNTMMKSTSKNTADIT